MNLQPLNDQIFVRVDLPEEKVGCCSCLTLAGANTGVVLAVGPAELKDDGTRTVIDLKVGDHIFFKGWGVEPVPTPRMAAS